MEARDEILYSRRHGVSMPTRGRKPMLSAAIAEYIDHHRRLAEQDEDRRRADGEMAAHALRTGAQKRGIFWQFRANCMVADGGGFSLKSLLPIS
jgi:hypothetical protein